MTIEIPLSQGKVAIIDDDDLPLVSGYRWYAWKGPMAKTYYAQASIKRADGTWTKIKMHRLIIGLTDPDVKVDHRDRNGLNNTRTNIRACSHGQNMRNSGTRSDNTSGFKGVYFDKRRGKWAAQIVVNGKNRYLGSFITPEEAHQAYCRAADELHGEFANYGTPPPKRWSKPSFEIIHTGAQR